jgi:hypothetical protein
MVNGAFELDESEAREPLQVEQTFERKVLDFIPCSPVNEPCLRQEKANLTSVVSGVNEP